MFILNIFSQVLSIFIIRKTIFGGYITDKNYSFADLEEGENGRCEKSILLGDTDYAWYLNSPKSMSRPKNCSQEEM